MPNSIIVRPARAEDKASVVAFCQNTFSWGDYIEHAWDGWLVNSNGCLLVALIDGHAAGIIHAALLDYDVVWLEGMRVNPDYRRQGVASVLDSAARAFARERGCKVARLATSVKNTAAQAVLDVNAYHRAARYNEWEAEPLRGDFSTLRIATEHDIDDILARWQNSDARAASHDVVPNYDWRWTPIDRTRLTVHVRQYQARIMPGGFALLRGYDEPDWNGVSIFALDGDTDQACAIALAVRAEAEYRGYAQVYASLADCAPVNAALERAGFKTDGGMFLYERDL